jgi:hypothetical protein
MGSRNEGEPKDPKARRRGRLFEVSPPPPAETLAPRSAETQTANDAPVATSDAVPAKQEPVADTALPSPEEPPAEPLTEPIAPIPSEDIQSIESSAVAAAEDASEASAKLAHDQRMKKPVPAMSYATGNASRNTRPEPSRPEPVASPMVRRSAPAVGLHPSPRRRSLAWLWAFVPALLLLAVLAALYSSGYRIGAHGLVPPPLHPGTR